MPIILPAETRGMSPSILGGRGVSSGVSWEAQLRDTCKKKLQSSLYQKKHSKHIAHQGINILILPPCT
jgi:hypothetical protein